MRDLAVWASGLTLAQVPPTVRAAARRHLLDGLGCLIAGVRRDAAPAAQEVASGLGGPPEATLLGCDTRVGAPAAAFGNAVAMHALDFDDTHAGGLVHATTVTAPVALAVAQQLGSTGSELLAAYVAGLETVCRLGAATPHGFHARGVHATSACGTIAAAVVAGRLMGLPAEVMADAIGIAASGSSGLLEFLATGSSTKQLHPGFAACNGILAARLAAAGATGPGSAIEGSRGLYAAFTGRRPDLSVLVGALGERWEAARITIKPYPACQLGHASIDAALSLRGGVDVERITGIELRLHPDALAIVGDRAPGTAYAAKFSAAWCVAAVLVDGALPVEVFDQPLRADLQRLAGITSLTARPSSGPAADAPGWLRVTLDDGTSLVGEVPRSGGGPDDPGLDALVLSKARGTIGPRAEVVRAAVDGLAEASDVEELVRSLA
ncbi:2-methylcitrate dehydratase PrpD [Allocatelliglobosispora scoriae]|uniref:2-methylcitrate dehydratase PrpD n=1 Tax=Allocatelliglobosispora scoriae TaxID=643052 RepID=A0A841BW84_9ACTN|nr:MmgE/PrpD family protein [Allocatelliglobosispora scoriae]MBB5873367.1 2-methylcitrate dehydratase PrpD [Allocatelliglobosispora scoriae]